MTRVQCDPSALAVVLEAVYQLKVQCGVYVLELLVAAFSLAVVPYVLLRGPVSHVARWLVREHILTDFFETSKRDTMLK